MTNQAIKEQAEYFGDVISVKEVPEQVLDRLRPWMGIDGRACIVVFARKQAMKAAADWLHLRSFAGRRIRVSHELAKRRGAGRGSHRPATGGRSRHLSEGSDASVHLDAHTVDAPVTRVSTCLGEGSDASAHLDVHSLTRVVTGASTQAGLRRLRPRA